MPEPAPAPVPDDGLFDHERLDVYQVTLRFLNAANQLASRIPKGRRILADELLRASVSILLNLSEGAGEFSQNEKKRFYRLAKRSATECAGILDACSVFGCIDENERDGARQLLHRIVSMLVRLASGTGAGRGAGTDSG